MTDTKLTDKQEMFIIEYLKCFNATKAAKNAGYSDRTAGSIGSENLAKPEIASRIRARMEEHAMGAHEVLFHLAEIARGDMDDLVDYKGNLDLYQARALGKTRLLKRVKNRSTTTEDSDINETEVEAYDRLRALELIGKHLAMFTDKIQVEDWRTQAIADIRAGRIAYAALAEAFDNDLATTLFREAGVPIQAE